MPPNLSNVSSVGSFEHVYTVKAYNKLPVHEFISKDTGLTVVIAEVDGPVVNGFFCLATEAFDDDGLPHTLEHLIFMASEEYPYKGVLDLLANRCLASGTNAWTDVDHTCYTMETAGYEGFLSLMPIYVDHILYPTLTDEAFITEVHHITKSGDDAGVVYCEMQGCENSGESRMHLAMQRAIYPGHCGYSSNTGGIMKNLRESTTNDKVRNYHKDFYRPENLKLIITGQIKPEDVFKALAPIEKKILAKGDRGPFTKPWQSLCPAVNESQNLYIKYPADDESHGMVAVAWRGPSAVKDVYGLSACSILMTYLTDLSIAPLQKQFVEIEDPYASEVSYGLLENSESCFYVSFENVPKEKLNEVKPKLDEVLKVLVDAGDIDLERLQSIINRQKLKNLSKLEEYPHSAIADLIIGHMLYGNTKEDLQHRMNPLDNLDKLSNEPKSFWVDLLAKWFVNNTVVSIQAEASCEEQVQMAAEEKARVDAQIEQLTTDGLLKQEQILNEAIEHNNRIPPPDLLTCVSIPGIEHINFHSISRYSSNSEDKSRINLSDTSVFTYCDHINTSFVYLVALLDSSSIDPEQRFYLPLLLEALFESPIYREGVLIPHEDVVTQLQSDTISTNVDIGFGGSTPSDFVCGKFAHTLIISFQVEQEKVDLGISWLRELIYQTKFTVERLKIIASKMANNVPLLKRSGRGMVRQLMKAMRFLPASNQYITNVLKQHKFLTNLLEKLDSDKCDEVIRDLENIRSIITDPSNVTLYCAADLDSLKTDLSAAINKFLPTDLNLIGNQKSLHVTADWQLLTPPNDTSLTLCVVGMGCLDSSEFIQTTPCIKTYDDPDMPAILVYAQYLIQAEGPLWKQIRGKGFAYGYSIALKVNEGLLYLSFSRATNVVGAYKETHEIISQQILNESWDQTLLESAKSSLIYEFITDEQSVASVSLCSLSSYFHSVAYEYNRTLLRLVNEVSLEDLNKVGRKYFEALIDPTKVKTAIVCDPSKVEEIANEFKAFNMEPHTYPSLEESFLND